MGIATSQPQSVVLAYNLPPAIGNLIEDYAVNVSAEQPRGTFWQRLAKKIANWDTGGRKARAARRALQDIFASIKDHTSQEAQVAKIFRQTLRELSTRYEERQGDGYRVVFPNTPYARVARRILRGGSLSGVSLGDRLVAAAAAGTPPAGVTLWPSLMWS